MKKNKILMRMLCALLCIVMLAAVVACGPVEDPDNPDNPDNPSTAATVHAVRLITDVKAGQKIANINIQIVDVYSDEIPANTFAAESDVVGKYASCDLYAGDYLTDKKIGATAAAGIEDYVVVTDFVDVEAEDVSDALQKVINDNPGKTLYFPDGTYKLKKSIKTPAHPAKQVSFKLSQYAVIAASAEWSEGNDSALVKIGAGEDGGTDKEKAEASSFFEGGYIDANKLASGISVEGGQNVYIHNVSVKGPRIGLDLKSDYTRADNLVIVGDQANSSIGIRVRGSYNQLDTMRIASVFVGVQAEASANIFKNLHPLYYAQGAGGLYENTDSCGFWDKSEGNFYEMCYSDQFATGFRMEGNTRSVYSRCFVFWWKADAYNSRNWGFASNGAFNSIIEGCRVDRHNNATDCQYLNLKSSYVGTGEGQILSPLISYGQAYKDNSKHYQAFVPDNFKVQG